MAAKRQTVGPVRRSRGALRACPAPGELFSRFLGPWYQFTTIEETPTCAGRNRRSCSRKPSVIT